MSSFLAKASRLTNVNTSDQNCLEFGILHRTPNGRKTYFRGVPRGILTTCLSIFRPGRKRLDRKASVQFLSVSEGGSVANSSVSRIRVTDCMAVARNLCAGGQARGVPVTPVSRGVWGHAPPENFEI